VKSHIVTNWLRNAAFFAAMLIPALCFADTTVPLGFSGPEFEFVELTANVHDSIVVVSGKVQNRSYRTARGNIIIYLRDAGNSVINSVEESLNRGISFGHGQAIPFEVAINKNIAPGSRNITVEFIEMKSQPYELPPSQTQPDLTVQPKVIPPLPLNVLPKPAEAPAPAVVRPNDVTTKIKKCQSRGGTWINNQCVISID
jgi:hypothetical protein